MILNLFKKKLFKNLTLLLSTLLFFACTSRTDMTTGDINRSLRVLVELDSSLYNTPDAATIDDEGNVYVTMPNYNNALDPANAKAQKIAKITPDNEISVFYEFPQDIIHTSTFLLGPMGIRFGPDGNLYIADMQIVAFNPTTFEIVPHFNYASRVIRINIENGEAVSSEVVITGLMAANGIEWKDDTLLVTDSLTRFSEQGQPLESAVYAFTLNELTNGKIVNISPYMQSEDPHLLIKFESANNGTLGFGADGITKDSDGNIYTSIAEEGVIYKTTFDDNGNVVNTQLFSESGKMRSADGIFWNEHDRNIYVADIADNAVYSVNESGEVTLIHINDDTRGLNGELDQPSEVIVRNGTELIVINMDASFAVAPGSVKNSTSDEPYNISIIDLK